jgi:hypothetical protein
VGRSDSRRLIGKGVSREPRRSVAVLRADWRKLDLLSSFGVHVTK